MNRCVLADKNIPFLDDFIPQGIELVHFDPNTSWSTVSPESRERCEAILVRTVSKIDATHFDVGLFPELKFVGTASAGFDHIDVAFLHSSGIHFSDAGGANAQAVGEYVASVLVHWSMQSGKALNDCKIGVIGYGHTGSKVGSIMNTLGCTIIPYDPPKSLRDQSFKSHSIDDVLQCDAITFHVPFTTTAEYPTRNWMDAYKFSHFGGQLIINAARGGIVDESALVEWAKNDTENRKFVLDVWENEPEINYLVAKSAWIGTPHIAGYSIQSKRNATRMVLKSMCATLNIPNSIADSCTSFLHLNVYENWHPLFELSESLINGLGEDPKQNANHFTHLRQHAKLRNEFRFMTPGKFSRLADYPLIQQLVRVCGGPL